MYEEAKSKRARTPKVKIKEENRMKSVKTTKRTISLLLILAMLLGMLQRRHSPPKRVRFPASSNTSR